MLTLQPSLNIVFIVNRMQFRMQAILSITVESNEVVGLLPLTVSLIIALESGLFTHN